MRFAIIEGGNVVNIAVADAPLEGNWIAAPEGVGIGWSFDGTDWTPPAEPEGPAPTAGTISRFQARAALMNAGLLTQVEQIVANADEITRLAWAEAVEWKRSSPTINSLGAQLGLSEAQMDALFAAAAEIEV